MRTIPDTVRASRSVRGRSGWLIPVRSVTGRTVAPEWRTSEPSWIGSSGALPVRILAVSAEVTG